MDRIKWFWVGSVFILLSSLPAFAADDFPESAFGQPPAKPEVAIDSGLPQRSPSSEAPAQTPSQAPVTRKIASSSPTPSLQENVKTSVNRGVQELAVIAGDLGFFPKTIFVLPDFPVRLFVTGTSERPLCIVMDSFEIRHQIRSHQIEEITFTPHTPGKYRFYCPVNGMEGNVVVKVGASNLSSELSQ